MKLLPTPPSADDKRANSEDSLGHGMDAVIMLVIFLGLGWGLDIVVGTIPVFMIAMTVLGSVGLFARFYYSYGRRMDRHDADRLAKLVGPVSASATADENGGAA